MALEDKTWLNQSLMYHKDFMYNSGGTFEVGLSCNTGDFKTFSATGLNISVTNNIRKVYNLNYQSAVDLLKSLGDLVKNISTALSTSNSIEVLKKHQMDKSLKIKVVKLNEEFVVSISVINNTTDYTEVIVPYSSIFIPFCSLLKTFVSDFIKLNLDFTLRSTISESLENIKLIKDSIKTIPSSIIEKVGDQGLKVNSLIEPTEELLEVNDMYKQLDTFLENNLDNIIIPEINTVPVEKKEEIRKIESDIITKVFKGNLATLEFMMSSLPISNDPIQTLITTILENVSLPNNFKFFPGSSEDDLKSLKFISKTVYNYLFYRFSSMGYPIPSVIPILKIKVNGIMQENLNIAYDFLLISAYLRILKNKLETKESNSLKNKSLLYFAVRTFIDPFIFSFIDSKDIAVIKSCVMERFKSYKSIGFFKTYEELLVNVRISEITENDISLFINELGEKALGKAVTIDKLHEQHYETKFVRLPTKNSLTLEQIIDEAIPFQQHIHSKGISPQDKEAVDEIIQSYKKPLSETIIDHFFGRKKREVKEKETNLVRACKFYSTDIPESYREEFINFVKERNVADYNFNESKFPLEEIKDNIIKVLYIWNECDKTITYTDFMSRVETCIPNKDLILSKYKVVKTEVVDESWTDFL